MAANDNTKTAAYENYPANSLTRGSAPAASVNNGTYIQVQVNTADFDELTIEARLTVGAADADLKVEVFPVDSLGNVMIAAQPPVQSVGPKFDATSAATTYWGVFDVSGQQAVAIRLTNGAATAKNISYNYHLD
jgi:hypothetical protein